jgi:hypothetical protein
MFPLMFPTIDVPRGWLFLEGHFAGTNKMLAWQRSAGTYQERRKELTQWRGSYDRYAGEVHRIRALVAKSAPRTGTWTERVLLGFALIGESHHPLDPSAWYLPGKAAEDGLQDAALLGSDRFGVLGTCGMVAHSNEESNRVWAWATGRPRIPGAQGMLVMWWLSGGVL